MHNPDLQHKAEKTNQVVAFQPISVNYSPVSQKISNINSMKDLLNIHVLIAEDDPVNMLVASKFLEAKLATVTTANNGIEALRILYSGKQTDLVLLDLEMPEMDGYSVIHKIRLKFPALPVLAFTASVLDRQMKQSLQLKGFSGAIPKPYNPPLFYEIIFTTLEKSAGKRPIGAAAEVSTRF